LVAFNPEQDLAANAAAMEAASRRVKSGEITYAVRSTRVNGHEIAAGDVLGLVEDELVASGREVEQVTEEVLTQMVSPASELITVFAGQDVAPEAAQQLAARLKDRFPQCEVELHSGGQPLYYYILSVE
ncbi:MAG TPA: DAK2 domain-containing protein, partial [Firmicutes bacterium]|nr:DAK2 domain-containing protein [Bacillota bacterium]